LADMADKWRINIFRSPMDKRDLTALLEKHKILKRTGENGAGTNWLKRQK